MKQAAVEVACDHSFFESLDGSAKPLPVEGMAKFQIGSSRMLSDDRGATAIEYAIIGALIGIGLIGSLVGTKTSLSAIFGTAATQMASSGAAGQASAPATGPGHWQAKTASAGFPKYVVGSNFYQASYAYTDGSTVTMTKVLDSNGAVYEYRADFYDATRGTNQQAKLYDGPSGNQTLFQIANYTAPNKAYPTDFTYVTSYGGAETTDTYVHPGTNDGTTTEKVVASTAAFRSLNDVYASEYGYFYGLGFTKPN